MYFNGLMMNRSKQIVIKHFPSCLLSVSLISTNAIYRSPSGLVNINDSTHPILNKNPG